MEDAQETAGPLRLNEILKGRLPVTKEARDVLSDLGMLSIGYFCTILEDISRTRALGSDDVEKIFESLRNPHRENKP